MINLFLRCSNSEDVGATNVSSRGAGLALFNNLEAHGAFISSNDRKTTSTTSTSSTTTRTTTRQFLATYGITFSNNVSSVGLRLKAHSFAPAGGKLELNSMRPSC
jgi:hypothetical protein